MLKPRAAAIFTVPSSPVCYQTFFKTGFRRYFQVAAPKETTPEAPQAIELPYATGADRNAAG
jgi:hypothetical protein